MSNILPFLRNPNPLIVLVIYLAILLETSFSKILCSMGYRSIIKTLFLLKHGKVLVNLLLLASNTQILSL